MLARTLTRLVLLVLLAAAARPASAQPLSLFRSFEGRVVYTGGAATFRTEANTGNACAVAATSPIAIAGIPAGATIEAAYVYWAGSGATPDYNVTLDGAAITAQRTFAQTFNPGSNNLSFFQGVREVTAQVSAKRNATYTLGALTVNNTSTPSNYCGVQAVIKAWNLHVVYSDPTRVRRSRINLYEGFLLGLNNTQTNDISDFETPGANQSGLTTVVWEGDPGQGTGESVDFSTTAIPGLASDTSDPFNSVTRQLDGTEAPVIFGVDYDTYNVSAIPTGTTRGTLTLTAATNDLVLLSSAVLSMQSLASDVAVTVAASDRTPAIGGSTVITVVATNGGPDRTSRVTVDVPIPAGYTLVSQSAPAGTTYNPSTGRWLLPDGLAVGGTERLTFTLRPDVDPPVTITATINAPDRVEANQANNVASTTVDALAPDLALTVSASPTSPVVGETATLTVDLRSENAARTTGVAVAAAVPAGYTLVSASPSQGTYAGSTWTVGTVDGNGSAQLTLTVRPTVPGTARFAAEVSAMDQPDADSTPGDGSTTRDDDDALTLTARAIDLELALAVSDATPALGGTVTYTVTLDNTGGADATGVAVRAPLPAGLTFVSTTGGYDPATGIWTVGGLAAGGRTTVQVTATVDSARPAPLVAEVSAADQPDVDSAPGNNDPSEDDRAVQALAVRYVDLALDASASSRAPAAGEPVTLAVDLSNEGTVGATGVRVSAPLPAGYTLVSSAPSQGSYNASTGVWTVGAVAVGATPRLELVARAAAGAATFASQITAADQPDADSTPGNNDPAEDDQDRVDLAGQPIDLALAVSVSDPTPDVGAPVTFTITLTNDGPATSTGVSVEALLPPGYTFVSSTPPAAGSYNPATGVWRPGPLAAGESMTLQIVATAETLDASAFTAQVTAADQDDADSVPNDGVGDDLASVAVQAQPIDLSLSAQVDNATPALGSDVTFTFSLANAGPAAATDITVSAPLPAGYTFISATPGASYNPSTGVWTVASLPAGQTLDLALRATAKTTDPAVASAQVTAARQLDADSTPGDGVGDDAASVAVQAQPTDLALAITASDTAPTLGSTVTFTVTLDNQSATGATGVGVAVPLPAGLTVVSATPSRGTYDTASGAWSVGEVGPRGQATLTLTATVDDARPQAVTAEVVTTDQPDADSTPGNADPAEDDQATVAIAVQAIDLALAITASQAAPIPGRAVTFQVTLANGRATDATGVAVRVPLPAGLTFVSASGTYDPETGSWSVGPVDGNGSATLDIVARVDTARPATVTAEVSAADQPDIDSAPGNGDADEDDQASVTVTPQVVDLALAMTVDEPQPAAGDVVTFVVTVTNESTTGATGVQVSDRLIDQPGVAEIVSVTPSAGTFDGSIWRVGALAAGARETLTIAVRLLRDNVAFTNLAEVAAADQPDTDSTPFNGSTFEDDNASATATTGGSSSGGEGGLESGGSLAEAIGGVLFARRAETGALADAGVALEPVAFRSARAAGASIRRFLPATGPRGATAVEVSPTDLLPVTNAREIVAADYLRTDGRRAGVVFASATAPGEIYEHTKPVCDRLRGAALDAVDLVDVEGRPFVMTRLVQLDGSVDYAVSFVAYGPDEARTVDSRFLLGDYDAPASGGDVLNLQVWSPSSEHTRALVAEVLASLRADGSLAFRNNWDTPRALTPLLTAGALADPMDRDSTASDAAARASRQRPAVSRPDLPVVFVRSAEYDQGRIRLDLYNAGGASSLRISGGTLARAEGGGRSVFSRTVDVASGTPEAPVVPVVIETGYLFDVAFFVETDLSPEPDRLYLADGTWGVVVDPSSEASRLANFAVRPQPETDLAEGQRLVERPVHATGTVATWATVYRTLRAGAQPLDLGGYQYLEVTAAGAGNVQLLLQKQSIVSADQFGATLALTPEPQTHRVWFEDLALADGSRGFTGEDAVALSFTRRSDGTARPLDVAVSGLRFGGATGDDAALPQEANLWPAMPNPFFGATRIRFELPQAQPVRVRVFDVLGREVARLADGEREAGRHTLSFSGSGLSAGVYMVRLELADRAFTRAMTLVR